MTTPEDNMAKAMNAARGGTKPPGVPPTTQATANPSAKPAKSAPGMQGLQNVAAAIAPQAQTQTRKEVVVEDAFDHNVAFNMSFLGSGQGGGRIANSFYELGYRRAAVVNTTEMDFDGLQDDLLKLDLGIGGAAKDAAFASAQLKGREEEIWDLLTRAWGSSTDYGLVCIGLGGGSGSGTAVQLVDIAKDYMQSKGKPPRVGAIVSLPTVSEGQLVARNAVKTFRDLVTKRVSPLVIIDNAKINTLYRPAMSKLHSVANNTVSQLFHLFNTLCEAPRSVYTFDRAEFGQLLDGGIVVMGAAAVDEVNNPADISTAIRDQLTGNVLAEVDLRKGRKGACLIVANQDQLDSLPEEYFAAGFDQLERILGSAYAEDVDTVVHRGLTQGDYAGIQIYMMISELEPPMKRLQELVQKAGMTQEHYRSSLAEFLGLDD